MKIAFYLPDKGLWDEIDYAQPFQKALGGRETACVRLAQEMARVGHDVSIYGQAKETFVDPVSHVAWRPLIRTALRDLQESDVVVSMEHPEIFSRVRARLNVVHYQCAHTAQGFPVGDLDKRIDHYFLLSNYQRFTLCDDDAKIDPLKCVVFGNGIDLERYDQIDVPTVPGRLVWSQSPDRGLHHLLRWWPELKERVPHLSLRVFYSVENIQAYRWQMEVRTEWCRAIDQAAALPGVEIIGKVDQTTLAREQKQAEFFFYPCDPIAPTETFCITALEYAAAGVPMVLSNADCLYEIYGAQRGAAWFIPLPVEDDLWINGITAIAGNKEQVLPSLPRARKLAEHFTWQNIAGRWLEFFEKRLTLNSREEGYDLVDEASTFAMAAGAA